MQQFSAFFIGVIFASVFTSSVSAWYGTVTFYQDVEFDGTKYPWGISKTQRCYNLSCWDNKASSVKWEGLPKKGSFSGKSRIAFYTDKNCKGDVRHWPTDAADDDGDTGHYPKDFTLDFVNDKITSFMVWETSEKITNGIFFYLPVSAWYGVVTFYQHTDFQGTDFPWSITKTQRCYNLGCFNDKASSVKWEGLPVIGKFNGQARIAFFTGKECTGDSRDWPTDGVINDKEGNYPKDFSLDGINDAVSSFMVWVSSKEARKGQDLPCAWGTN